jgi:hypothetical protein
MIKASKIVILAIDTCRRYDEAQWRGPYQPKAMTGNRRNCAAAEYFNLRVARNDAS